MSYYFRLSSVAAQVVSSPGGMSLYFPFSHSEVPAAFFGHVFHENGGDIRIRVGTEADSTLVAMRLVGFSKSGETGGVWVYFTPSSSVDVDLYCHYGDSAYTIWNPQTWAISITNPNAETNVSGWTNVTGAASRYTGGPTGGPFQPYLESAGAYWWGGTNPTVLTYQDLTFDSSHNAPIDAGERAFRIDWLQASFSTSDFDRAQMEVEFFDGGGSSLGARVGAQLLRVTPQFWEAQRWQVNIPPTTRTIRLFQNIVRGTGTNNNGYLYGLSPFLVERSAADGWAAFENCWDYAFIGGSAYIEDLAGSRWAVSSGAVKMGRSVSTSSNIGGHSGMAISTDDPTKVWVIADNQIRHWTATGGANGTYAGATWTLQGTNSNPGGQAGIVGTPHCSDGCYYDGHIYIPISVDGTGAQMRIAKFTADASMTFVDQVDITAQGNSCASICYQPDQHRFYTVQFRAADATGVRTLNYYNPDTRAHLGNIFLSSDIIEMQGITWFDDSFWITSDGGPFTNGVYRVDLDGTVHESIFGGATSLLQGLDHNGVNLCVYFDNGASQVIREVGLSGNIDYYGGGITFAGFGSARWMFSPNFSQTFSIGITYKLTSVAATQTFMSWGVRDSGTDSNRVSMGFDQSTSKIFLWNSTNGFREPASATYSVNTIGRAYGNHNAGVNQQLFVNGVLEATTTPGSNRPATGSDCLWSGAADADNTQAVTGDVGYITLSYTPKSADFIATEWNCLSAPETFWDVGAEVEIAANPAEYYYLRYIAGIGNYVQERIWAKAKSLCLRLYHWATQNWRRRQSHRLR